MQCLGKAFVEIMGECVFVFKKGTYYFDELIDFNSCNKAID